jgi:hypothetical protein
MVYTFDARRGRLYKQRMLTIEPLHALGRFFARLPEFTAIGLMVLLLVGVADLLVHVLDTPFLVIGGADRSEAVAHGLVVVGVGLTLGGLVLTAVRFQRTRADNTKGVIATPRSN